MNEPKFKVGDMVRIKKHDSLFGNRYPIGTVKPVKEVHKTPFNKLSCNTYTVGIWRYIEDELELVDSAVLREETKTYEQGLEDGWNLIKKIFPISYSDRIEIFDVDEFNNGLEDINYKFTASEIIEKIKRWEEIKSINVGDVGILKGEIQGVVTYTHDDDTIDVLLSDGRTTRSERREDFKKINRSIDISELLGDIRKVEKVEL